MADRTNHEPVRVGAYQTVDSISGELSLKEASSTLERAGSRHLFGQILQDMLRVTVQAIGYISEIVHYGTGPYHRYDCDWKLEALPCRAGRCDAGHCPIQ